jgi:hypothetical protein
MELPHLVFVLMMEFLRFEVCFNYITVHVDISVFIRFAQPYFSNNRNRIMSWKKTCLSRLTKESGTFLYQKML